MQKWLDAPETTIPRLDYREAIEETSFAEDYDLTEDDIDHIDFALSEYASRKNDADAKKIRESSQSAAGLLEKAARAISRTVSRLDDIEHNRYALSALIAELPELLGNDKNDDEQIEELNAAINAVRLLERAISQASTKRQYSDGLPAFGVGAPTDPEELRLTYRLNEIVTRIREREAKRNAESEESEEIALKEAEPIIFASDANAEAISELLDVVDIINTKKTIRNKLLSRGDYPFPTIDGKRDEFTG
jgi:hypothetical protein